MCIGGSKAPPPQQAPAPPPPPPLDSPAAPALNEAGTEAANADAAVAGARRGTRSLRVNRNMSTGESSTSSPGRGSVTTGLGV